MQNQSTISVDKDKKALQVEMLLDKRAKSIKYDIKTQ